MKKITITELCRMTETEGLVLQGCGGELQEWVDGINELFTEEGILQNGDKFKEISFFEHDGLTNLVFHMEGVDLNIGRLVVWRLNTHENFGGTWLSDYLSNKFGAHVQKSIENGKPDCPLIGQNGNVFHLMGVASRTLQKNGLADQAKEMCDRIRSCGGYDETIGIMGEYVNIISVEGKEMGGMEMR